MTNCARKLAATIVLAASMSSLASVAPAAPIAHALAIKNAAPAMVETVQFRRWGWGVGAGLVAGAIVGGAIANSNPYYYGYGPYYSAPYPYYAAPPPVVYGAPGPVYGAPGPAYGAPAAAPGDAVAYCMQRYKSYDPASGTFLGYDGQRHPCP
jgi:BA14K-like protein